MAEENSPKVNKIDLDTHLRNQEKEIAVGEKELETLTADLSDFEEKIDEEFVPYFMKSLTDDETEMMEFGESIEDKIALVLSKRVQFVDEQIEPRRAKIAEFEAALNAQKTDYQNNTIVKEFRDAHPDVDIEEFGEFIRTDLTPKQLAALEKEANGDVMKFYESALALMQEENKSTEKDEADDLPPNLDDLPSGGGDREVPKTDNGFMDNFKDRKF